MRYHYIPGRIDSSIYAKIYICDHERGVVNQECGEEFHSDIIGDAIGTTMAEAHEYFGDPDDEYDYMD